VPEDRAPQLERLVGHPGDRNDELLQRVQAEAITQFTHVQNDWLQLMWCIDRYRIEGVAPRGIGNLGKPETTRLAAVYRMKGNWFAKLIAALLQNRTSQEIAAKGQVQGFSQPLQVDIAWPARDVDPLVCIHTLVTGAPAYGSTPARGAMSDWSKRRKEVKFAATDLKLWRRQEEPIENWGVWRANAPPKTYFLWAARLRTGPSPDNLNTLVREARLLGDTYLDGVGILVWRECSDGNGYEAVPLPHEAGQVTTLDDVISRVATEIKRRAPHGTPPAPEQPREEAPDVSEVLPDQSD
jgi:hypothetical protein